MTTTTATSEPETPPKLDAAKRDADSPKLRRALPYVLPLIAVAAVLIVVSISLVTR